MTEAMLRDVQEKLQQKHKEAQKSLEDMRGYFEVLMNAARDLGELRNCGYTDDLTSAEKQLRVAFAQLAASQSVLEDYLRESSEVQRRLSEAAHEDDDEDDEDGGGEESRRQREAQKEERFLRKINSAAKQLARFPVLASEPEKEGADPKKHPLYAQFNAKLAVCAQRDAEHQRHRQKQTRKRPYTGNGVREHKRGRPAHDAQEDQRHLPADAKGSCGPRHKVCCCRSCCCCFTFPSPSRTLTVDMPLFLLLWTVRRVGIHTAKLRCRNGLTQRAAWCGVRWRAARRC